MSNRSATNTAEPIRGRLLDGCNRRQHARIQALSTTLTIPDGETICRQGERGRQMFLIVSGTVTLSRNGHAVGLATAGEPVGELGLLEEPWGIQPLTAVTATHCVMAIFSAAEFRCMLEEIPLVGTRLHARATDQLAHLIRLTPADQPAVPQPAH